MYSNKIKLYNRNIYTHIILKMLYMCLPNSIPITSINYI